MFPKDLVVFIDADEPGRGRLAYAANLAKRWQAHLIATFVTRALSVNPHVGFATGTALAQMLADHEASVAATMGQARAEFDALVDRRSFTAEWRTSRDESGEALMLHARHASLAVLGPPACQAACATTLGLSEDMIFASGRPCLLLPLRWPEARTVRRICIGWNGGREATRAIAAAMPFLVDAETVHVVVVPDAPVRRLYGADPGVDMATHLARQRVNVVLDQLVGEEAGAVLLDYCAQIDADLLVAGAMGRSRISEVVLGGATRTMFANARLPLLLSA